MRVLLLAVVVCCGSCAFRHAATHGDEPKPIKHVFDFKLLQSSGLMAERLRNEFGEKYPGVQFTPERYVQRVYVRYDDCFVLTPEALQAIKLKVEELDRSE